MQDLSVRRDGAIARVTLDRPKVMNAYSEAMIESFVAVFDELEADDAVRAVVLTGAGRAFSAGGDLGRMQARAGMFEGDPVRLRTAYVRHVQRVPRRLAHFDKPVIAAVNGAAVGAGLDLACMCDLRVAASTAKFGSTFVKIGLVPGDGGAYYLARTIGFPRALELVLSGRLIDATEAERVGLVHAVVEPDALLGEAETRAERIAANAPLAVRLTKRAAYRSWDLGEEAALELAATYQALAQHTEDHDAAVDAFQAKATPEFKGH